jgi:hypothetical protein
VSKVKEYLERVVGEGIALIVGWLICSAVLAGAYSLGRWAAPLLGWELAPDTFGLLSVITFVWTYEHRNMETKYNRLRDLLDEHLPNRS